MARKPSALAALDIVSEGLAQQDGLAERLSRQRAARTAEAPAAIAAPPEQGDLTETGRAGQGAGKPHNAWRRGKALLQVAIPDEVHLELSILAKRRRMTLSQLMKDALNQWLDSHGHTLRLPK
jgi:hypothetical protein